MNKQSLDASQKKRILKLARQVLENALLHTHHDLGLLQSPEIREQRGVFVSLHIKEKLRGCIGRLEAQNSIYQNVIDLSKAAAFEDHRFKALTAKELEKVKIEVSILSRPVKLEGASTIEKISKIKPKRDGVIISKGYHNATFLPQVWESVSIREDFISELCRKAGLPADYWESNDLDISVYQVDHFSEE